MRTAMIHFAKYMATYTALMFASYLLWIAAGSPADAAAAAATSAQAADLLAASNFLMPLSLLAYPVWALIAFIVRHLSSHRASRTYSAPTKVEGPAKANLT